VPVPSLAVGTKLVAKLAASKFVNALPLAAGSVAGNLASGTVPEAKSSASKFVKLAPLTAGNVAGNLASGTVPEAKLSAFKFVKLLQLFATMFPLASSITDFDAGKVQKTFFVPAAKSTALSEFDDEIIVVLAKVPAATVPSPTSNSALVVFTIA